MEKGNMQTTSDLRGIIVKISGPVLDVRFDNAMPHIHDLLVTSGGMHMEVAAHVAPHVVRCIALEATDGLSCGVEAISTGGGIKVPVGDGVLGRVVNV